MLKKQMEENRKNDMQQRSMQTSLVENRSSANDLLYDGTFAVSKLTYDKYLIVFLSQIFRVNSKLKYHWRDEKIYSVLTS